MKRMKQKMAAVLAAVLMLSSMPVTAAGAMPPDGAGESGVADAGMAAGIGTAAEVETQTLSGQLVKDWQAAAAELAEELYAKLSEEDIAELVQRAADAFLETETPAETDGWDILLPFIGEEVKGYLEDLLEKAKAEYADLEKEEVCQAVFDSMYEKIMESVEAFLKENSPSVMSLQPLEEEEMSVDLRGMTPVELTMTPFSRIFAGKDMTGVDKIAYAYASSSSSDDYVIGDYAGTANISLGTYSSYPYPWLMIPSGEQLDTSVKRYIVRVQNTVSEEWLVPTVYAQDDGGNRKEAEVTDFYYHDSGARYMRIELSGSDVSIGNQVYLKFDLNSSLYGNSANRSSIKVYEGNYATAEEAMAGTDITDKIYGNIDMGQQDAGYASAANSTSRWITVVSFDADGKVTGCLPFYFYYSFKDYISTGSMFKRTESGRDYATYSYSTSKAADDSVTETHNLYAGYAADDTYCFTMSYIPKGEESSDNSMVTGAYVGQYSSIAEAQSAGAENIKDKLFNTNYNTGGYEADYSNGVDFSIFVGADGYGQEVYHYCIITKEGNQKKNTFQNSGTDVWFTGLVDADGNRVACYIVDSKDDSYAEGSYPTIVVEKDTELTKLAPVFSTNTGVSLYAIGSSEKEVSGKSYHDFSNGPIHYTTSSENGENQKNVWLAVKTEDTAETTYNIYTNSLADSEAETTIIDGVIYSKREVILKDSSDGHDIFLMNMGSNTIPKLSVELVSDTVMLDEYWTLNGNHDLSPFDGVEDTTRYGELANMAKVRLKMKDGVTSGELVTGTLTVKADGVVIMVLELTGIAGAPVLTTDTIPEAVKYVPYGTMIQNSNKYSKTKVSYTVSTGNLPDGMELRENGELYGVPKEAGTFQFRVQLTSQNPSGSMSRLYTLEVKENTDANVNGATDSGYTVTQRIPMVAIGSAGNHEFVSQGVLDEFVDVFLDGEKLVKGVDYTAESGSTRLTISSQTLTRANEVGTHTLGVEFRTSDENLLRKAAQNFNVVSEGTIIDNGNSGGGNSENGASGDGASGDGDYGNSGSDGGSFAGTLGNAGTPSEAGAAVGTPNVETIIYAVAPGDTLSKIAVKYYGDASMWRKIYEDNRDIISNPNRIRVGMKLKIYLTKTVDMPAADIPAAGRTYTVQKGDNLWNISKRVYGSGAQWRMIYEANKSKIPDSAVLRVGQVITIP